VGDGDQAGDAGDPERVSIRAGIPPARNGSFGIANGSAPAAIWSAVAVNGSGKGGYGSGVVGAGIALGAFPVPPAHTLAAAPAHGQAPESAMAEVLPFPTRRASGMPGHWPLQTFLELGALDGAVPSARLHARHVLWEWGLSGLRDTIELVVSELVTNGVQATRSMAQAAIRLWLFSDRGQVVVLVWDASPQPPERMDVDDDAENGRGLLLVESVSTQWGWYFPGDEGSMPIADQHGKFVWAIVR
jgi:anti-sigma regulatory factor (Ser/Thr protein kinase)